jgi:guanylate kinase
VDRDTFLARAEAGGFEEWTEFAGNGHLYGTPTVEPPAGHDAVFEIELNGARQVKARHPDALLILIVAPSLEVQEARMRARGDDDEHIKRRLEVGQKEEEVGRQLADEVVINDDVDRAAREVAGILQRYR